MQLRLAGTPPQPAPPAASFRVVVVVLLVAAIVIASLSTGQLFTAESLVGLAITALMAIGVALVMRRVSSRMQRGRLAQGAPVCRVCGQALDPGVEPLKVSAGRRCHECGHPFPPG